MSDSAVIHLQALSKTYGEGSAAEVQALRAVNLEIARGEFVAIVGRHRWAFRFGQVDPDESDRLSRHAQPGPLPV